jgi:hypothetical protein
MNGKDEISESLGLLRDKVTSNVWKHISEILFGF